MLLALFEVYKCPFVSVQNILLDNNHNLYFCFSLIRKWSSVYFIEKLLCQDQSLEPDTPGVLPSFTLCFYVDLPLNVAWESIDLVTGQ